MSERGGSDRAFVVVATLVALFVRVAWLGQNDFWSDEIHSLEAVALPVTELVRERLAAGHQPLYFLLLKAWSTVAGNGELVLRLPSALFGALCVVPAYGLFRRVLDRPAARLATDLLVLHPLWVELGREARMYSLLALCFLVLTEAVAAALEDGRIRRRFWIALALGPFVHATWALGLAAVAVWVLVVRRGRPGEDRVACRTVLLGLAASGVLVLVGSLLATTSGLPMARRPWDEEAIVYVLRQFSGAGIARDLAWMVGAVALVWGGALVVGWRGLAPKGRALAGALCVVPHVGAAAAALAAGAAWGPVRYVSLAVVGYALLAGAACASRAWLRLPLILAVLAALLAGMIPVRTRWSTEAWDVRTGAITVEDALESCPGEGERIVLRHYLRHPR